MRSEIWEGARPHRALEVRIKILKGIRKIEDSEETLKQGGGGVRVLDQLQTVRFLLVQSGERPHVRTQKHE